MISVLLLAPLVFAAALAYDFAIAKYVVCVGDRDGHRAGLWSGATYLVGLIGTLGIIKVSVLLVLPEVIGLYVGTRLAVSLHADEPCKRGLHIEPCDDEDCWSNSPAAAQIRIRMGWYDR